jgi:cephalosporin hydroxylase
LSKNHPQQFDEEVQSRLAALGQDEVLQKATADWIRASLPNKYSYNFSWLGRPIIQYPQDMVAVQEMIWRVKPDLIVETGIAHGGSLILSASMLALLDICEAAQARHNFDPKKSRRKVLGIDIDIRAHNQAAIAAHPLASYIEMIQGSSVKADIVNQVHARARQCTTVMVFLDSNHTHSHVLEELMAYAPLTSKDSYCVVFDTIVERLPKSAFDDRPWGPGNNPMTAVDAYLADHPEFEIDTSMDNKLQITVAPRGYLRRIGN